MAQRSAPRQAPALSNAREPRPHAAHTRSTSGSATVKSNADTRAVCSRGPTSTSALDDPSARARLAGVP
eukprot:2664310-Prymnesium_polylepis.1